MTTTSSPSEPTPPTTPTATVRQTVGGWLTAARRWLEKPENLRTAAKAALPVLVLLGLLLPPISLVTRLTTIGYTTVRPGEAASIAVDSGRAAIELGRRDLIRTTRLQLREDPRGAPEPPGRTISPIYAIDIRGPTPVDGSLSVQLPIGEDDHPYVDPYGWDGERWRWLAPQFVARDRVQIALPFDEFTPQYVTVTLAGEGSTEVSAVLLPPPAAVPAAVAELPVLELRAYRLESDDGTIAGHAFPVPARDTRRYGVIHNRERHRIRADLINNILIVPEHRRRHRESIVEAARRAELDGIVLDYRGVEGDLQPELAGLVRLLADDLHRIGAELIVTVPMPRRAAARWDPTPYNWQTLGRAADALRIALPDDEPLEVEALDSLVRWALTHVARHRLQLAVPVQGRDVVGDEVHRISYGDALAYVLDTAKSDAPRRITPGQTVEIELPTIAAAEIGRDEATGMWRFNYWDLNRRKHTVWLNDALGLKPAFDIAARYRLNRLALDGVTSGLDPALWSMVESFIADGRAEAPPTEYRLLWQLVDEMGRPVHEAEQPLDVSRFTFRAPSERGTYRLGVKLLTTGDRLAAVGDPVQIAVAPPPPPTPVPTAPIIMIEPTPETYETAPPPLDERVSMTRTPVRVESEADGTAPPAAADAEISYATAALRTGPGVAFELESDLRIGQRLMVLEQSADGEWLHVRVLSTGIEGWVLAELIELNVDLDAVPTTAATPTPVE